MRSGGLPIATGAATVGPDAPEVIEEHSDRDRGKDYERSAGEKQTPTAAPPHPAVDLR